MRTRFPGLAAMASLAACFTLQVTAASLQRISVSDPTQHSSASADGDSWTPIMTPDARYVLFASTADNLIVRTNGTPFPRLIPPRQNVYLRDRQTGTTILISVNLSGTQGGNGNSTPTDLSTDGRYALFESTASDLVAGDTNNANDVFVRDVVNGATFLVTTNDNGGVANGLPLFIQWIYILDTSRCVFGDRKPRAHHGNRRLQINLSTRFDGLSDVVAIAAGGFVPS